MSDHDIDHDITLNPEDIEAGNEVSRSMESQIVDTMINYCNQIENAAIRLLAGTRGPCTTGAVLATMMAKDYSLLQPEVPSDELADATLFATLLAWHVRDPRRTELQYRELALQARKSWEAVTGRQFDHRWMSPSLARAFEEN